MRKSLLFFFLLLAVFAFGQDTIILNEKNLNHSIADQFTIYKSDKKIDLTEFSYKSQREQLDKIKLNHSVENLDFTSSYYYCHFLLINQTESGQLFYFETARPITNVVSLVPVYRRALEFERFMQSGDAVPFDAKPTYSSRNVFPIYAATGDTVYCLLELGSDGEIISLPMIFWQPDQYFKSEIRRQYSSGIFYGFFLFVILIYGTFYVLLRDRLYLLYTLYVFFSGFLQFALDGYAHQYLFTSGGYLTQHSVIIAAGLTVFFAYLYASTYLQLEGKLYRIAKILAGTVLSITLLSLIPGKIYELCYPLINGFSLLSLFFLFFVGLRIRRTNRNISRLFLFGLFTLMASAIIFILGNFSVIDMPFLTQNSLKLGTLVEVICLSILMTAKYKQLQDEKEKAQKRLLFELEEKTRIALETNVRLEEEVAERTKEIEEQKSQLKYRNEDLLSSIKYAQRIQEALLPSDPRIKKWFPESFVFYRPKDIVSGDFYWIEEVQTTNDTPTQMILFATADCTGHGVPGAFVSVVCNNLLKLSKIQRDVNTTGEALDFIDKEINQLLNSEYSNLEIRDGMDIALCAVNLSTKALLFSGAKSPLFLIREGNLEVFKGDRRAIGNDGGTEAFHYETQVIQLQSGDLLYTFSDGIPDQFGGAEGKKFLTKRLKELLLSVSMLKMEEQHQKIAAEIDAWMKGYEQVDDMLLVGIRID